MRSTRLEGISPSLAPGAVPARRSRTPWRLLAAFTVSMVGLAFGVTSCLERPLCTDDCRPRTTNVFVATVDQGAVDKIDLLFMIDNSASMADKEVVLSQAVPNLVQRLVSPNCVDSDGTQHETPKSPSDECPAGTEREFQPIKDIHIGVITSSLGGHGGDKCDPRTNEQNDDRGHLLGTRPRFAQSAAAAPGGFLTWNPKTNPNQNVDDLTATFQNMTTLAGENGCGFEAQLESIYRFLVDPSPPGSVTRGQCAGGATCAVVSGLDTELLSERSAFLRPDSLVAVILLTDENDCSVQDGGQYLLPTLAGPGELTRGSSACAANPNDRCCYSCAASKIPDNCPGDPACASKAAVPAKDDNINLRCYQQKRRFGFDFLYPVQRYVNALTARTLCTSRADLDATNPAACPDNNKDQKPDMVESPLFKGGRSSDLVFLAGILGVPWQDLQATKKTKDGPDYTSDQLAKELHYKTADQLTAEKLWDKILGTPNPGNGAPPLLPSDALMVESTAARPGVDGQGHSLAGSAAGPMANPVNGHDWQSAARDDLEYACIFRLPADPMTHKQSRTCTEADPGDCYERAPGDNNPLCQDPKTGTYGVEQFFAKAYPGTRELEVLRGFGKNAIVASICARNVDVATKDTAQDYGYRPAVDAVVDRLASVLTGRCLPRKLQKDESGHYPCSVLEANPQEGAVCDPSRRRIAPKLAVIGPAVERLRAAAFCDAEGRPACNQLTLCEIQEAGPECHQNQENQPVPGWCYVDPAANPGDDRSLVKNCDPTTPQTLRFVDPLRATPAPGARVVIACMGADLGQSAATPTPSAAPVLSVSGDAGR
jgi:hypothetical protein